MTKAVWALLLQGAATTGALESPPMACNAPVYMVVEGRTHDRARMMRYAQAIAESKIYQQLGGYYITQPRPIEVFEGELPPDHVNLTVRFPCIENARAFWNSRVYRQEILPIRQEPTSAGTYTVSIYAEAPLRQDMVGRVGDNRFIADFSGHSVPQMDPPVAVPAQGDAP